MSDPPDLRMSLADVLSDRPTREGTRVFLDQCFRVAVAYLRRKQQVRRLYPGYFGLSLPDLAMDCVAALFERDARGRFTKLRPYFDREDWTALDADALLMLVRRLVYSAVNDRLFQCYREEDGALSNLIRSLKRAAEGLDVVRIERRGSTRWVVLPVEPAEDARPLMPPEFLEARLSPAVREGASAGSLLAEAIRVLRAYPSYAAAYPLTVLAQVIRSATVRVSEGDGFASTEPVMLSGFDVRRLIERCVATTRADLWQTYVGKRKVDEATYGCYFDAIRDRLETQFVRQNGKEHTNYRALQAYLQDLSREDYGTAHRAIFEYLSRCTRDRLVAMLREDS